MSGDLWILCEHGEAKAHDSWKHPPPSTSAVRIRCPGGRSPNMEELIAELRTLGVEGVVRIEYIGRPAEPFYVEEVPDARRL